VGSVDDEPRDKTGGAPPWLPLALSAAALIGVAVLAIVYAAGRSSGSPATCHVSTVAGDVLPSVVTINTAARGAAGNGSGEVIRSDGYILTNDHVISSIVGGGHLSVTFADGTRVNATVTGHDPRTDLAVIKIAPPFDLRVIALGATGDVHVGQPVVALGAPLGLSSTVTSGIVSALDRTVELPTGEGKQALLVSAIQTDAAINPGNSGGALVDCQGRLVGVPTAGAAVPGGGGGSIGLGFAIPVDLAIAVANELIAHGRAQHSSMGLAATPISPQAAQMAGKPSGLAVTAVVPGGPAAKAGLRVGDVITSIDGQAAESANQLEAVMLTKRAGETVSVEYFRAGQTFKATITLAAG
jgi:putative serine protease PepD